MNIKNKYIALIFVLGYCIRSLGAIGKINSEPWGGPLLATGLFMSAVSVVLIVYKLFQHPKVKEFLNK